MRARITTTLLPALQGVRYPLRQIVGQAVRHDQKPCMKLPGLKETNGQPDEVVTVARDEDPLFNRRKAKLLFVWKAAPVNLVYGDDIKAKATGDLSDGWIEIFVQQEPHQPA